MIHRYRFTTRLVSLLILIFISVTSTADTRPTSNPVAQSPHQKIADALLKDILTTTWIAEGKGPHVIYIFFDPNCPACNQLNHTFRPWVEQGQIELRWIPVGTLMTTSLGKAAALLEAKNPLAALTENETKFSRETGFGGIAEEPLPRDATLKRLDNNLDVLKHTVNMAVPTMVFRNKENQATFIQGAPPAGPLGQIVREVK